MVGVRRRRSERPRRVMATFAAAVGVGTLLATVVLDADLAFRLPYAGDLAAEYATWKAPTIVAVGSSRTCDGLEVNRATAYLQESLPGRGLSLFSAAVVGCGVATHESVLEAVLEAGPKPEAVILEVSPDFLDARARFVHLKRDLTWGRLLDLREELFEKYGSRLLENRLLPVYSRRFEVRRAAWRWAFERLGLAPPKIDPLEPSVPVLCAERVPESPMPPLMTEALRERQRRLSSTPLKHFRPTGTAARALERMLAACEQRGIPALMVNSPACSALRDALAPASGEYAAYIASLLKRFPTARYDDAGAAIPDEGFKDHYHANLYGQDLLCRRLSQAVLPVAFASWERGGGVESPVQVGMTAGQSTPAAR